MLNEFKKFDNDKPRLELIEPEFILGLGRILTFGAKKYEKDNWKKGTSKEDGDRVFGALMRHLMAYRNGEMADEDTGESHLYHAACNLMFLDYYNRVGDDENVGELNNITQVRDFIASNTEYKYAGVGMNGDYVIEHTATAERLKFKNIDEIVAWLSIDKMS